MTTRRWPTVMALTAAIEFAGGTAVAQHHRRHATPTPATAVPPAAAPATTPPATTPAATTPPATPADTAQAAARAQFQRGLELYNSQDFNGALAEFLAAYETSHRPNLLYNIGVTHQALHHYPEAARSIEQFLREATMTPERRAQVTAGLDEIRNFIAHIRIEGVPAGATITLDGERVGTTPLSAPLAVGTGRHELNIAAEGYRDVHETFLIAGGQEREIRPEMHSLSGAGGSPIVGATGGQIVVRGAPPNGVIEVDNRPGTETQPNLVLIGHHTVRVRAPGYRTWAGELNIGPNETRTVTVRLQRDTRPSPVPVIVAGGVALGAGIASIVMAQVTLGTWNRFQMVGTQNPDSPETAMLSSTGTTQRTITNVLLVVTGVGVAATIGLFVQNRVATPPDSTAAIAFAPRPEGGADAAVRVRF